jgi:hypothetical protein
VNQRYAITGKEYIHMQKNKKILITGIVGFLMGTFIGYLYRPSAFLIGQLSFKDVILRGTTFKGLDQIYIPVAEKSFNYLMGGGIIGAISVITVVMLFQGKSK